MSFRESLLKSIAETEVVIENTKRYYETAGHPAFLAEIEIESLRKRLEDLKLQLSQIEVAQTCEHLKVTFHPPNLPTGKISARTFSSIVWGIQAISDSIANAMYNQPSAQGRIPADLLTKHTWLITAQKAGSYEVTMEMNHEQQPNFEEPTQISAVSELFSLFSCSNDHDLLFETVSRLGVRALRHYRDWTKHVRDEGTPIEIEWTSANRGIDTVYFDADKAARIFEVLTNISEGEPEEVEVKGKLTGADSRLKTFRLETEEGHFISGTILPDQVQKVGAIVLESLCRVKLLKVKTVYQTTGKEKITWTLQEIDVVER